MATLTQSPRFNTGQPFVQNTGKELRLSMPISNIGTARAANVSINDMTLGVARRLSPAQYPQFVGQLQINNVASVAGRFDSSALTVGGKYLLTVRGTYQTAQVVSGFTVNRYITVPAQSQPTIQLLKARVTVDTRPGVWTYTIFNDENVLSHQFIAALSLDIATPVTVTGSPPGWQVQTDNNKFVLWFANDVQLPYPHHVAPGHSLGGFQIQSGTTHSESTAFILTAWDHQLNKAGLVFPDVVLSPSRSF